MLYKKTTWKNNKNCHNKTKSKCKIRI